MFLHLGADTVIPLRDVITITDIKTVRSGINDEFLRVMYQKEMPKVLLLPIRWFFFPPYHQLP